jgi:hypothetical protein
MEEVLRIKPHQWSTVAEILEHTKYQELFRNITLHPEQYEIDTEIIPDGDGYYTAEIVINKYV